MMFDSVVGHGRVDIVDETIGLSLKVLGGKIPNEVWRRALGKVVSKTNHSKRALRSRMECRPWNVSYGIKAVEFRSWNLDHGMMDPREA